MPLHPQGFVVTKVLSWKNIMIRVEDGVEELPEPEDDTIIGFLPVYRDLPTAIQQSGGCQILPLYFDGSTVKANITGESNGT